MTVPASTSTSMPGSKKRRWTLLFKDINNNIKEAELLSSFRKRYTSVTKLAFRSPAAYTADTTTDCASYSADSNNHPTKTTKGGSLCIEVQFTGPQPVEGPAGLMGNLLQGTFVAANPVQLGRARKRKVWPGASYTSSTAVSAFASAPSGSSGSSGSNAGSTYRPAGSSAMRTEYDTAGTDSSITSNTSSSSGGGSGRYGVDYRLEHSHSGVAAASMGAAARMKRATAEYDAPSFSTNSTGGFAQPLFSGTASTASTISTTSDLEILLDDSREDRSSSESYPNKRSYPSSPLHGQQSNVSRCGSIGDDIFAAFGGMRLNFGNSAAAAAAATTAADTNAAVADPIAAIDDGVDLPGAPHLGRSGSTMTNAGDDLPKWDDVVRRAATTTTVSAAPNDIPPESRGYHAGRGKVMSQDEFASLFAGTATPTAGVNGVGAAGGSAAAVAAAAAAAATAAGGVVVSEDGLWEGAPTEAGSLFCAPALGRHTSFSWGLHPAHAVTAAVVAADDDNGGDDDAAGAGSRRVSNGHQQHQAAVAASVQRQQQQHPSAWYGDGQGRTNVAAAAAAASSVGGVNLPPVESEISFAWHEEECDFDGHSTAPSSTAADMVPAQHLLPSSPFSSSFFPAAFRHRPTPRPCHFSFSGLRSIAAQGYDPRDLAVFARFFVDPEAKVEREASPLELDAATGNDRATSAVAYPSIREIWPEVYKTAHIRAVEVDMYVEIRSTSGELIYTGPTLTVSYRRPAARASPAAVDTARPQIPRTITTTTSFSSSSSSSSSSSTSSSSSSSSSGRNDAGYGLLDTTLYARGVDLMDQL